MIYSPSTPVPDDPSLEAECLVAFTGIFPTRAPSELEIRGAANYIARVRRRLAAFLDGDEVAPLMWTRPPAQVDLWGDLNKPFDDDELSEWFAGWQGDPATHVNYPAILQSARDRVKAAWPIYPDPSLGLHNFELAPDEYGEVWHLCRTLNDPETMFDDLDSLVLLPVQVDAIAAVYPALYAKIQSLAMLLVQPFIGIEGSLEPKKNLPMNREEQLRTLLQLANDAPIQTAGEKPKANVRPASQDQQSNRDSDNNQTPSEHIAQRRTLQR
jgi:hypothetical protein